MDSGCLQAPFLWEDVGDGVVVVTEGSELCLLFENGLEGESGRWKGRKKW
jgi:hypothetical protein